MNKEKHQHFLNTQKFERLAFSLDYIQKMKDIQGEVKDDDFITCLIKAYDDGFNDGKYDVLDRSVKSMNEEIDEIEDEMNNK
jgi:hypothetical protein